MGAAKFPVEGNAERGFANDQLAGFGHLPRVCRSATLCQSACFRLPNRFWRFKPSSRQPNRRFNPLGEGGLSRQVKQILKRSEGVRVRLRDRLLLGEFEVDPFRLLS